MITLAPARTKRRATVADARGPEGLVAHLQPFVTGGGLLAYRYNDPSNNVPPPANFAGSLFDGTIPVDAVYVVRYYNTPLGWVTKDGTVTVVDDSYGRPRTRQVITLLHAWLGVAVDGTSSHAHHVQQGYRKATPQEWERARLRWPEAVDA